LIKSKRYNKLIVQITELLRQNRQQTLIVINHKIIHTYWHIGRYIVEYEQEGKARAEYGKELFKNLSSDLSNHFSKGFSYRNLQLFRQFYLTFPNWQSLIAQSLEQNLQSSIAKSFELKPAEIALTKCNWTQLVRLLSIRNKTERNFYLIECVENNWSVRELERQIQSSLFERLLINKDKSVLKIIKHKGQQIDKADDVLKDPYVLEFLGIDEHVAYSETELETAIINNIEKFLLELGKGFSFVARQMRISAGSEHFKIDLVFYNRLLRCHVLIDLKIGKLKHQDIGQMQMYVNYFDREIKTAYEQPTIGVILCKEKNDFVIEYSLPKNNNQIYPKEYQLYMPDKDSLKSLLEKYI